MFFWREIKQCTTDLLGNADLGLYQIFLWTVKLGTFFNVIRLLKKDIRKTRSIWSCPMDRNSKHFLTEGSSKTFKLEAEPLHFIIATKKLGTHLKKPSPRFRPAWCFVDGGVRGRGDPASFKKIKKAVYGWCYPWDSHGRYQACYNSSFKLLPPFAWRNPSSTDRYRALRKLWKSIWM